MLNRKEYVVGGLTKALIPVVKRVAKVFTETDSEKEKGYQHMRLYFEIWKE